MRLHVSDHAFARYCDRVLGLNRAVLERSLRQAIGTTKDGRYKIPGQPYIAIVSDGVVCTIVPDRAPRGQPGHKQ